MGVKLEVKMEVKRYAQDECLVIGDGFVKVDRFGITIEFPTYAIGHIIQLLICVLVYVSYIMR